MLRQGINVYKVWRWTLSIKSLWKRGCTRLFGSVHATPYFQYEAQARGAAAPPRSLILTIFGHTLSCYLIGFNFVSPDIFWSNFLAVNKFFLIVLQVFFSGRSRGLRPRHRPFSQRFCQMRLQKSKKWKNYSFFDSMVALLRGFWDFWSDICHS